MDTIKKLRKIIIVLLFIVAVAVATSVKAQVGDSFIVTDSSTTIKNGHFNPYPVDSGHPNWMFYCIHHGSPYKANLPEGYTEGMESNETWCNTCVPVKPDAPKYGTAEWAKDTVKSMKYTSVGPVDDSKYQDAAYVMAEAYENGTLRELATQYSIWDTMLNVGKRDDNKGNYGLEAEAYLNFYKTIHNGTTDVYSANVADETVVDKIKVKVDQTTKTYIVGPFTVRYPQGEYVGNGRSKKWSYIKNIHLLNQSNSKIGDVVSNTLHIIDESGNELRDSINNNNFPDTGEVFYAKFTSTSDDLHNIKLQVDFEYLESCAASLEKFEGQLESWVWQIVATDKKCQFKDLEHHKGKDSTIYTWRLAKTVGGTPQELVALKTDTNVAGGNACAEKRYKQTSLIVVPGGVDLTMKLSGNVWLDKNTGKVNTGNNVMDSGEALSGVRVTLYDTSNNLVTISNTTVPYHQHTNSCYTTLSHIHSGNAQTGGGCYTKRTSHVHSGSWSLEDVYDSNGNLLYAKGGPGTCYNQPINHVHVGSPNLEDHETETEPHEHSGSSTTGGGCYTKPVYHQHTYDCYEAGHQHNANCYQTSTEMCGAIGTWTLVGDSHRKEKNSTCGHILENSTYNDDGVPGEVCTRHHTYCGMMVKKKVLTCKLSTDKKLICEKTEGKSIDSYELGCGFTTTGSFHTHQGNEITGGPCYSPIYHEHNMNCGTQHGVDTDGDGIADVIQFIYTCGKTTETIIGYKLTCTKTWEGEDTTTYKGSGCYTVPIYDASGKLVRYGLGCGYGSPTDHVHEGSPYVSGGTTTSHTHTGSPVTGGGCYTKAIKHEHSIEKCGWGPVGGGMLIRYDWLCGIDDTKILGYQADCEFVHHHKGNETTGGECYKPKYHEHTDECYTGGHTHSLDKCYEWCMGQMYCMYGDHTYHKCRNDSSHITTDFEYQSKLTPATPGENCTMSEHNGGKCHWSVLKCTIPESNGTITCGKTDKTIEKYVLDCDKEGELEEGTTEDFRGCYTVPVYKEDGKTIDHYDLGCGFDDNVDNTLVAWGLSCTEPLYATDCDNEPTKSLTCGLSNTTTTPITITQQNPVITDSNGYYEFVGLNSMKKYYVKFEYNGMVYTNVALGNLDTNADNVSKADETTRYNRRQPFNAKFSEIGSFPANYGNGKRAYFQEDIVDAVKGVLRDGSYNADKGKEQFAKDCIIEAYSVKNYPLIDKFIIDTVGTTDYPPIYSGKYNQLHVNLGIKERPTFDMALYKDVLKADVKINGKTETYTYDARKQSSGFKFGISESEYLNGARAAYQNSQIWTNSQRTWGIETDEYYLDVRREEVANGQSSNYNKTYTQYQVNNNYDLKEEDRLKVYITYKLTVRNQSSVPGAVTELVDYFDPNYVVAESYVGDANGNKTGNVTVSETSKYPANTQYKSTKGAYKTVYLTPTRTVLGNGNEQYIYVKLELKTNSKDAGTILSEKLLNGQTLGTLNLAEINGYTTTEGLIDIDSNPGNLNISNISALTQPNLTSYPNIREMYEDDSSRAPALIYKVTDARTLEGAVFEDATGKDDTIYTGQVREGDGVITAQDTTRIKGVRVDLVEIKNGSEIIRATTYTDGGGWYGFVGFVPGDYKIKYTYGQNKETAMTTNSLIQGQNAKSYNGQDYQSTKFTAKSGGYWYKADTDSGIARSDATDTQSSIDRVRNYSRTTDNVAIANHKAEVFNAYVNPQPLNITPNINASLVNELMQNTYREAYTPTMEIEVEYATKVVAGNKQYAHTIKGVDLGVVERAKSELTIDQDIRNIRVTLADGSVLIDTQKGLNNVDNLQWVAANKWIKDIKGKALIDAWNNLDVYDKQEMVNIIIDDELLNGAQLEITYNLTVTNNGEKDEKGINATTRAKGIINYVANNLTFDVADNNGLWAVVNKNDIQNTSRKTLVNNSVVDLSTQSVILKATDSNPLTKALKPGEQISAELVLKKVLSAENASDDLRYANMTEIVEIDNELGRYDHGAIPGNQKLDTNPKEHDTSGASKEVPNIQTEAFDGIIIITPPTGSNYTIYIYTIIGTIVALVLAGGIFLIKKFVLGKK